MHDSNKQNKNKSSSLGISWLLPPFRFLNEAHKREGGKKYNDALHNCMACNILTYWIYNVTACSGAELDTCGSLVACTVMRHLGVNEVSLKGAQISVMPHSPLLGMWKMHDNPGGIKQSSTAIPFDRNLRLTVCIYLDMSEGFITK